MRRVGLDYEHVEWPGLYKRLCVLALRLTRGLPDILDGTSVEDLAEDTLTDFFASPVALGWDGRDLTAFLCGVLRNRFLTRLRREKRMAGSLDDGDFTRRLHQIADGQVSAEHAVALKERVANLKNGVSGDGELEELIEAMSATNGDHHINQELADYLQTTVAEVINRKKRLQRLLGQKGPRDGQA